MFLREIMSSGVPARPVMFGVWPEVSSWRVCLVLAADGMGEGPFGISVFSQFAGLLESLYVS